MTPWHAGGAVGFVQLIDSTACVQASMFDIGEVATRPQTPALPQHESRACDSHELINASLGTGRTTLVHADGSVCVATSLHVIWLIAVVHVETDAAVLDACRLHVFEFWQQPAMMDVVHESVLADEPHVTATGQNVAATALH
jgi:hypothetical protein